MHGQYATINSFFVNLFCLLLPFALLKEFDELNNVVTGMLKGYMVWPVIPFSALISWVNTSLDQIDESTSRFMLAGDECRLRYSPGFSSFTSTSSQSP